MMLRMACTKVFCLHTRLTSAMRPSGGKEQVGVEKGGIE